jgi:transcription antitermination factor NusG
MPWPASPEPSIPGTCGLLKFNREAAVMQEREVERIRRISESDIPLTVHPEIHIGERVIIAEGPLKGLEGDLIRFKNQYRLVINAHVLGQSASLEIGIETIEKHS